MSKILKKISNSLKKKIDRIDSIKNFSSSKKIIDKDILGNNIQGDVIGVNVSGSGNIIGKYINIYWDSTSLSVTYAVIDYKENQVRNIIEQIALDLDIESSTNMPFVNPESFSSFIEQKKMLLYGSSGSGKTRCIYEILTQKLRSNNPNSFKHIYVINPKTAKDKNIFPNEPLTEFIKKVGEDDIIIWDNFPMGILDEDNINNGITALSKVTGGRVLNILLSIKYQVFNVYKDIIFDLPDISKSKIEYSLESIYDLVQQIGEKIPSYQQEYTTFIKNNLNAISKTLYDREPVPMTVYQYYKALLSQQIKANRFLDAETLAKDFELPSTYYDQELTRIKEASLIEFLIILYLSYELKLDRKLSSLKQLQKQIFNSDSPNEPTRVLVTWIEFISEKYYVLPDLARNAIEHSRRYAERKGEIITYITKHNFLEYISTTPDNVYSFGIFLGKNIQFLINEVDNSLLPNDIHNFVNNQVDNNRWNLDLKEGLGAGIGKVFSTLNKTIQLLVLELSPKDPNIIVGLDKTIGYSFNSLKDREIQEKMLNLVENDDFFGSSLGDFLGYEFLALDGSTQERALDLVFKNKRNFSLWLGHGLGYKFSTLSPELQTRLLNLVEKNDYFAYGLAEGHGLGYPIQGFNEIIKKKIWDKVNTNVEYADGLAHALGYQFFQLNYNLQVKILNIAYSNKEFADGLYHIWVKQIMFRELRPFSQYIVLLPDQLQLQLMYIIQRHATELGDLIKMLIQNERTMLDDESQKKMFELQLKCGWIY